MCKAVAEDVAEEEGSTINSGILYIIAIVYGIIMITALTVYRKRIFAFFRDLKNAGVPH
jgi:hypothetical protein